MSARRPQQPQSALTRRHMLLGTALFGVTVGCSSLGSLAGANPPPNASTETFAVTYTDAQWRQRLNPAQYTLQQPTQRRASCRCLRLCGLCAGPFLIDNQIRQWHWLAQLLPSPRQRRRRARRRFAGHVAHRGPVPPVRQSPRPPLRRWPANRAARKVGQPGLRRAAQDELRQALPFHSRLPCLLHARREVVEALKHVTHQR